MTTFGIANTWQANNWQYQKLESKIGNQPNTTEYLAFGECWHANFWHQTNHALYSLPTASVDVHKVVESNL